MMFTKKEKELLELASNGCKKKEIMEIMQIKPPTFNAYLQKMFLKTNTQNYGDLLAVYFSQSKGE